MADKLWFSHAVEGLFVRGLGERLTPAVRAVLKRHGIEVDRLQPGYPVERVFAACRELVPMLFPGRSEAEGLYELGAAFMHGYQSTLIGKAMVQVMKVIGARRSLERMQRNFATGGNYIETRFEAKSAHEAELWFNDCGGVPEFYRGILDAGGAMIGARDLRTESLPETSPAARFRITWSE